ncbi:ABC transporter substrate-binding protein [Sinosporangium siamense]|uniref:ABC transporter substrate-binding protein n=1 Tax=Sinosporangium siamense TaxID=1367973 RepID=A0A919V746_9ACTN|nr:extracellular solute-binding protein [Sinosporangium siamense]GII93108.1 ABC transporter substrate-binding protein [Sinosporangium siamense]
MTVRNILATTLGCVVLSGVLSGCGSADERVYPPPNPQGASLAAGFSTMDRLIEAAKKEGVLNVAALPRDWVNYGEIIDIFANEYGIKVSQLDPGGNSQREIEAVKRGGAQAPDVLDLTLDAAVANSELFAPYKVLGWQDIPDDLKEPGGAWYAAYGGYISIGYDSRKVQPPTTFADLLKPGYTVALPGDPRETVAAFSGVMATSLSAGRPEAARGVEFFGKLKQAGNLADPKGQATAVLDWDYLNSARAAKEPGAWKVTIPRDAVLGSYYVQAVNRKAPHPAAARLWQEFLFSDRGQNLFLKGFARPARMEALLMKGTVDQEAADRLPAALGKPVILTVPQTDEAKSYLHRSWAKTLG